MKFSSFLLTSLLLPSISAFLPPQLARGFGRPFISQEDLVRKHRTCAFTLPRRDFVVGGTTALASSGVLAANSAGAETSSKPIADLPMIRLKLPKGGFGREYVAIQLKIDGQGPFEFMLDTGLTTEFITPHLQQVLGILDDKASTIRGLAAGGESAATLVELKGASLCCGAITTTDDSGTSEANEYPLPPLHAVITDFPQEHIDPAHDPVEGMLGMEMLSLFDVDFDFPKGRVRFWKPGTAAKAASGMVEIPAVVINETGLIGIRIATPGDKKQPVLGFLDCGSTFSAVNWLAASYLGLPKKGDPVYNKSPSVLGMGIDGRPLPLPTISKELTFTGKMETDESGKVIGFESPPASWKPWKNIQLAIGDLPAFQTVLGDGIIPYKGPAALIGLDVLAQRRVILETDTEGTRRRRVLVSSK